MLYRGGNRNKWQLVKRVILRVLFFLKEMKLNDSLTARQTPILGQRKKRDSLLILFKKGNQSSNALQWSEPNCQFDKWNRFSVERQ
jgi:hypothetical protein